MLNLQFIDVTLQQCVIVSISEYIKKNKNLFVHLFICFKYILFMLKKIKNAPHMSSNSLACILREDKPLKLGNRN